MKRAGFPVRSGVFLGLLLLLPVSPAGAGLPRLAEVPPALPAPERAGLERKRAVLLKAQETLREVIARHNGSCRNVRPDSARMAECGAAQKRLQSRIQAHAAKAVLFNARVAGAAGGR